jgi:hypothetical protein
MWDEDRVSIAGDVLPLLDSVLDCDCFGMFHAVDIILQMTDDLGWPHSVLTCLANNDG